MVRITTSYVLNQYFVLAQEMYLWGLLLVSSTVTQEVLSYSEMYGWGSTRGIYRPQERISSRGAHVSSKFI